MPDTIARPEHEVVTSSSAKTYEESDPNAIRQRKQASSNNEVTTTGVDITDDAERIPTKERMDLILEPNEEDPEVVKNRHNQNIRLPLTFFLLSFIFPPLGWIGFMKARDSPRETPRGKWAFRACALGSFLAFAYTLIAACLVGHYGQLSDSDATDWGCGFGGKCPLFKET